MGKTKRAIDKTDDSPLTLTAFKEEIENFKEKFMAEMTQIISQTMKKHLHELEGKIARQQEEINALKRVVQSAETEKLKTVRRELAPNLIIRGLYENDGETSEALKDRVNDLFVTLETDVVVHVKSIHRVGKRSDSRPRMVKVVTGGVTERNAVLKKGSLLRQHRKFQHVFVDSDKCWLDRRENQILRRTAKLLRGSHPSSEVNILRGILFLDNEEVDRADPIQNLFSNA